MLSIFKRLYFIFLRCSGCLFLLHLPQLQMSLDELLIQLKEKLPLIDKKNEAVSGAAIGWHVQHSLMVINVIVRSLESSNEKDYTWKFNFLRTFILTIGKFPRGKVQSPKSVRPKEAYSFDSLQSDFLTTEINVKKLETLPQNAFFTHPIFGDLNLKPAIRFLKLHTVHHLKIINDIIK